MRHPKRHPNRYLSGIFTLALAIGTGGCASQIKITNTQDNNDIDRRPEPPVINVLPQDAAELVRDYRRPCVILYDRHRVIQHRKKENGDDDYKKKPKDPYLRVSLCSGKKKEVRLKVDF